MQPVTDRHHRALLSTTDHTNNYAARGLEAPLGQQHLQQTLSVSLQNDKATYLPITLLKLYLHHEKMHNPVLNHFL